MRYIDLQIMIYEFLNEAKICSKLHQFSKNWSCFTCCSLCVKGFPSVRHRCRKGVFPGCWLTDSSVVFRSDVLLAEELNTFYGRFECNGGATLPISASGSSRQNSDEHVITVSEDEVRRELKRVNVRKATGPDGITGRVLRSCADQLAGLFTSIFNESIATSVIPTSFKKSVIIPVPKNSKPSCLNDYCPVALTSTVMKVFERLLKKKHMLLHPCYF